MSFGIHPKKKLDSKNTTNNKLPPLMKKGWFLSSKKDDVKLFHDESRKLKSKGDGSRKVAKIFPNFSITRIPKKIDIINNVAVQNTTVVASNSKLAKSQVNPMSRLRDGNPSLRGAERTRQNRYYYYIGRGNNECIVRQVMMKRGWWYEANETAKNLNFRWQQTCKGIFWERFKENANEVPICFNHFEFTYEIGTKDNIMKNLIQYCERQNIYVYNFVPPTFEIKLGDNIDTDLSIFSLFHNHLKNFKPGEEINYEKVQDTVTCPKEKGKLAQKLNRSLLGPLKTMPGTYNQGHYMWQLKPTNFNRGNGIEVFNTINELNVMIQKIDQINLKDSSKAVLPVNSIATHTKAQIDKIFRKGKFIIQKYCEDIMLVNNRKFDIRILVLVDHNMNLYILREGYLRLSSKNFSLEDGDITNKYIHLTNNAIQKNCQDYCMFESGNQMSFDEFQEHLDNKNIKLDIKNTIYPKMKNIASIVMKSIRKKQNCNRRKFCFEVLGFDFQIDNSFNLWLIEANINPCIEQSSTFLNSLIPRMLDDAFKLSIDKIFPKPYSSEEPLMAFAVNGYSDEENLWDYMCNLQGGTPLNPTQAKQSETSTPFTNMNATPTSADAKNPDNKMKRVINNCTVLKDTTEETSEKVIQSDKNKSKDQAKTTGMQPDIETKAIWNKEGEVLVNSLINAKEKTPRSVVNSQKVKEMERPDCVNKSVEVNPSVRGPLANNSTNDIKDTLKKR